MDLNKIMESIADVIDQKPSFTMWFVFKDGEKDYLEIEAPPPHESGIDLFLC